MIMQPRLDLEAQFAAIDDADFALSDTARRIEADLQVCLPEGFGRICGFFDGCAVEVGDGMPPGDGPFAETVVALTASFRRDLGLPGPYVVLGADDEAILLLACAGASLGVGRVHMIARSALGRFSAGTEPSGSRSWPSFVEYFAEALHAGADGAGR
jgi:hypothetical protein